CVLPGQTVQPSITNPINIENAVAGTAQAAATQTALANPLPTTANMASTSTPTPKVSSSGTALVTLADDSTQFIDYISGMQMVFPAGWLVVRVGEDEYYTAWGSPESQTPVFMDILTGIQSLDPKVFRVHALDMRSDHIINNDITRVDVVFSQNDIRTLKEVQADEKKNHPRYKSYKLLTSKIFDTPQGIQALNIEAQWATSNGASQTGLSYHRRVLYKVSTGVIAIDLYTLLDKKDLTTPDLEQVINNITFFDL
ncbi:MAG TPA: hypothetical protein VFQ13_02260, partial [Anaerolineales bacterium]|nr:hypothetical protein [Anaerolineales bacterium]